MPQLYPWKYKTFTSKCQNYLQNEDFRNPWEQPEIVIPVNQISSEQLVSEKLVLLEGVMQVKSPPFSSPLDRLRMVKKILEPF